MNILKPNILKYKMSQTCPRRLMTSGVRI